MNRRSVSPSEIRQMQAKMLKQWLKSFFLLGGMPVWTDTYKRTMTAADLRFATAPAAYSVTPRRAPQEFAPDKRMIMAGHEKILSQWFLQPIRRRAIETYVAWASSMSAVKAISHPLWDMILDQQEGPELRLPVNIWGFPGGQTFVAGVPVMSCQGVGGAVSYVEPALVRMFGPIIQATKGRFMQQAVEPALPDGEVGLRGASGDAEHLAMLLWRFIGSGNGLTSSDGAEFMFGALMTAMGTIGHELLSSFQTVEMPLEDSEYDALSGYFNAMGGISILPDLTDQETVGLYNTLRLMQAHPDSDKIHVRLDKGDPACETMRFRNAMNRIRIFGRKITYENGVNLEIVGSVNDTLEANGHDPALTRPAAGGWWQQGVERDVVQMAMKRTMTGDQPNAKLSPGKETYSGDLRVGRQGKSLIVYHADETIDAEPLFVQLVKDGRIVYDEFMDFETQHARAVRTWEQTDGKVLESPQVAAWRDMFRRKRLESIERVTPRLAEILDEGGAQ